MCDDWKNWMSAVCLEKVGGCSVLMMLIQMVIEVVCHSDQVQHHP